MEKTNNKVRIGILGAGKVAREIHLPVIKNMSNAEIIWLCDVSPVAATAANAYVPGARVHNSIDDCEPVDVVLVTDPRGLQARSASQGYRTWLECPLREAFRCHAG